MLTGLFMVCMAGWVSEVWAQAFACDGDFYLSLTPSRQRNSLIVRANIQNGVVSFDTLVADIGTQVLPLAFSAWDNHLYGVTVPGRKLLRINAWGQVAVVADLSAKLNPTLSFDAGCATPNGRRLVLIGHDSVAGTDKEIVTVRLDGSNYATNKTAVLSSAPVQVEDLAFSPIYGILFGYDVRAQQMVEISLTGLVTPRGREMSNVLGGMGSLFFNKQGELFGYGRAQGGDKDDGFYQMDYLQGKAVRLGDGQRVVISDGCSCPFSIDFIKEFDQPPLAPCTEATLTYRVTSYAGASYEFVEIHDTLPPGFTVAGAAYLPVGTSLMVGSVGSGVVSIMVSDLLLGQNLFKVKVNVGQVPAGRYGSQAWLSQFPLGLGVRIPSDDPETRRLADSTVVEVAGIQLGAEPANGSLCPGQKLTLTASGSGPFLWENGPGPARREVDVPGWYWVEVQNACGTFRDSLFVSGPSVSPFADLGSNLSLDLGQPLSSQALTGGDGPLTYSWSYSGMAGQWCDTCPQASFIPLNSGQLLLSVTDTYGCTATDSIEVMVTAELAVYGPNVFTPNHDLINDRFFLYGEAPGVVRWVKVYDRWGRLVWKNESMPLNAPDLGWDGTFEGKEMPEAVYFYAAEIEIIDGRTLPLSGYVTLLR